MLDLSNFGIWIHLSGDGTHPGPNMIYLISRSISQAKSQDLFLGGVAVGFVFYMLCASFGITALVVAVPYAYDTIRIAGAMYLLWLAWKALRPNAAPILILKIWRLTHH